MDFGHITIKMNIGYSWTTFVEHFGISESDYDSNCMQQTEVVQGIGPKISMKIKNNVAPLSQMQMYHALIVQLGHPEHQ